MTNEERARERARAKAQTIMSTRAFANGSDYWLAVDAMQDALLAAETELHRVEGERDEAQKESAASVRREVICFDLAKQQRDRELAGARTLLGRCVAALMQNPARNLKLRRDLAEFIGATNPGEETRTL